MLFVREPVSDFVKDQTGIYAAIETSVSSFVEEKTQEIQAGQAQMTDKVIDSLNLPDVLTKSLEQSNSKAVYEQRGIQNIAAYITGWLTDLAFEAVCCIISFCCCMDFASYCNNGFSRNCETACFCIRLTVLQAPFAGFVLR